MDRYQVKFKTSPMAEPRYGICHTFEADYKKYEAKGLILIHDAILPRNWLVIPQDVTDLPTDFGGEFDKHIEAEHDKATALSKSLPDGVHPGSMFSIGVADGSTHYVVTKVGKVKCDVEWRGFCMDRYTDHHFGWGGKFPVKDVARYVSQARAWDKLVTVPMPLHKFKKEE